jgi:hypothetical protein
VPNRGSVITHWAIRDYETLFDMSEPSPPSRLYLEMLSLRANQSPSGACFDSQKGQVATHAILLD